MSDTNLPSEQSIKILPSGEQAYQSLLDNSVNSKSKLKNDLVSRTIKKHVSNPRHVLDSSSEKIPNVTSSKDTQKKNTLSVTKCVEQYLNKFNDNAQFGIRLHDYFDKFLTENIIPPNMDADEQKVFSQFLSFLDYHSNLELYKSEWPIKYTYNGKTISGKIDAVFKKKPNSKNYNKNLYYIIDWKTSLDITLSKKLEFQLILNVYSQLLKKELNQEDLDIQLFLVFFHYSRESFVVESLTYLPKFSLNDFLEVIEF